MLPQGEPNSLNPTGAAPPRFGPHPIGLLRVPPASGFAYFRYPSPRRCFTDSSSSSTSCAFFRP